MKHRCLLVLALMLGFLAGGDRSATASELRFAGDLLASDPRFNRPEGGSEPPFVLSLTGTAVPYDVFPWYSSSSFDVDISVGSNGIGEQPRVFIYQDSFDPANPLLNVIYQGSGSTVTPDPFRQYFVVVCGDNNSSMVVQYEGVLEQASSGQLFIGVVPEPSVGMVVAAAGGAWSVWQVRRRRRGAISLGKVWRHSS